MAYARTASLISETLLLVEIGALPRFLSDHELFHMLFSGFRTPADHPEARAGFPVHNCSSVGYIGSLRIMDLCPWSIHPHSASQFRAEF